MAGPAGWRGRNAAPVLARTGQSRAEFAMTRVPMADPHYQALVRAAEDGDATAALEIAHECELRGQRAVALGWLQQAADSGNPLAMTELGARLVVGRAVPCAPADGAALIAAAAQQGDAGAWACAAVLAAAGVGRVQSWPDAFDALGRAAALGDQKAARQLELLHDTGVRGAPDAADWLSGARGQNLRQEPRLDTYAGFLTPAWCAHLIQRTPQLVEARVYDVHNANRGVLKEDKMRTNTYAGFSLTDSDLVIQLVRARLAHTAGVAADKLETTNVLHYAPGERYELHFDFLNPAVPQLAPLVRAQGQRVKTCLIYLNDDYEGGETEFPKLGLKFRGRTGDALCFENVRADGAIDMSTLHAGLPPARGEKWLLSQWVRDKPQPVE